MIDKKDNKLKPDLISLHGEYRNLKSYQAAEIIYDASVVFCDLFVDKRSHTHRTYIESSPPEVAANTLKCLIHQANYLLDQQLLQLEKQFLEKGGFTEELYQVRQQAKRNWHAHS